MSDIFKVSIIFLLILLFLRKKVKIGYALLAGSLFFSILYKIEFIKIFDSLSRALLSPITINLFLSLTLIRSFEYTLRQTELMKKMSETSQLMFKNRKLSIISMPLIIGMLPSLGGAYLSAPMVESATKNLEISDNEKAFINYWYRHPWELILPLYPGIVLASAISGVSLRHLFFLNLSVAVAFFVVGFFLSMKNVKSQPDRVIAISERIRMSFNFIPIFAVLIAVLFLKLELSLALLINIVGLCIYKKSSIKSLLSYIIYGFTLDVLILVFGVVVFKEMIQISGAVNGITEALSQAKIPHLLIFVSIPLITGLITGVSVGFVGSSFPLLLHLKSAYPYEISIAFVSGYIGVLLSPLHLCLILTREYFKADFTGIYKKIIPGCLCMFLIALIQFSIFRYHS